MSNFQEYRVSFDTLLALIEHAEKMRGLVKYTEASPDQMVSIQCYEAETLDNIVGEMRCLINEANKRSNYLKNLAAEDV